MMSNKIGILAPDGTFYTCTTYEHLSMSQHICINILSNVPNNIQVKGVACEEYLHHMGYVTVRARDVYGLIGYPNKDRQIVHLTKQQRDWLVSEYENMPEDKRKTVDYMLDVLDR